MGQRNKPLKTIKADRYPSAIIDIDEVRQIISAVTLNRMNAEFTVAAIDVPVVANALKDAECRFSISGQVFNVMPPLPKIKPTFDYQEFNEFQDEIREVETIEQKIAALAAEHLEVRKVMRILKDDPDASLYGVLQLQSMVQEALESDPANIERKRQLNLKNNKAYKARKRAAEKARKKP